MTDNIFRATAKPDLLSIIVFAIAFGLSASKLRLADGETNHVLAFAKQANKIVMSLVVMIIGWAPVAVLSLVSGALAENGDVPFRNIDAS